MTIQDSSGDTIAAEMIGKLLEIYSNDKCSLYLDRPNAAQLARILQRFADTGSLPEKDADATTSN